MIVFCMMIPLSIPVGKAAYAVEKDLSTIEVINNSKYVSDSQVERLKEGVQAEYTAPNGEVIPLNCTVTIEDVECDIMSRQSGARSYAVTVSATKNASNIGDFNGKTVVATASITMRWVDVPGIANKMENLSGSITVDKGEIDHGKVTYGSSHTSTTLRPNFNIGTDTKFNVDVDYTSGAITGSLHACYVTYFKGVPFTSNLTVCVTPSIFD